MPLACMYQFVRLDNISAFNIRVKPYAFEKRKGAGLLRLINYSPQRNHLPHEPDNQKQYPDHVDRKDQVTQRDLLLLYRNGLVLVNADRTGIYRKGLLYSLCNEEFAYPFVM